MIEHCIFLPLLHVNMVRLRGSQQHSTSTCWLGAGVGWSYVMWGHTGAPKSKFNVEPGIMVYSFFWSHLIIENVHFKNLSNAALVPLSIFLYLIIILPFGTKTPKKI